MTIQITVKALIAAFLLAGDSLFTLKSARTGQHYTYRATRSKNDDGSDGKFWFISAMVGTENTNRKHFLYIGLIAAGSNDTFRTTRGTKLPAHSKRLQAFDFFWNRAMNTDADELTEAIEFYHEGRCGKCGRTLTHPESIQSGLGPVCSGRTNRNTPTIRPIQPTVDDEHTRALAARYNNRPRRTSREILRETEAKHRAQVVENQRARFAAKLNAGRPSNNVWSDDDFTPVSFDDTDAATGQAVAMIDLD